MNIEIIKQKEMLLKLNSELYEFKKMLVGNVPVEADGTMKEDYLTDTVRINTICIEVALKTLEEIKKIMIGEK